VEVRRADRGAARAAVGPAIKPVPARPRPAHGRRGTGLVSHPVPQRARAQDVHAYEDAAFEEADPAGAEAGFAAFAGECELAREAVAGASLDKELTLSEGRTRSLRWVYNHMIEEYARHNGHADLLRERIDGVTGS
jgi:hypothetical protein